jgi:hypothetical protein
MFVIRDRLYAHPVYITTSEKHVSFQVTEPPSSELTHFRTFSKTSSLLHTQPTAHVLNGYANCRHPNSGSAYELLGPAPPLL